MAESSVQPFTETWPFFASMPTAIRSLPNSLGQLGDEFEPTRRHLAKPTMTRETPASERALRNAALSRMPPPTWHRDA